MRHSGKTSSTISWQIAYMYFLAYESLSLSKSLCNSINLQVPRSSLLAVVGQVGTGKSSIVSAVLGEMEKLHGHVTVRVSHLCYFSVVTIYNMQKIICCVIVFILSIRHMFHLLLLIHIHRVPEIRLTLFCTLF